MFTADKSVMKPQCLTFLLPVSTHTTTGESFEQASRTTKIPFPLCKNSQAAKIAKKSFAMPVLVSKNKKTNIRLLASEVCPLVWIICLHFKNLEYKWVYQKKQSA